ncbi:hypothetical protein M8J75_003187 [Diaphorina citri]|nr:hypothetical protein M8J75_003187 [Diaphorina citri]
MPWYRVMNTIGLYHSSLLGHGNENDTPLEISRAEVRQAIIDIKTHKAPGYDNIPGTAIKNSVNLVEGIFTELARNCAEVGYFPDDWKVGNLVHIPKGPDKDPYSLKSYRPLTMLCEFSKQPNISSQPIWLRQWLQHDPLYAGTFQDHRLRQRQVYLLMIPLPVGVNLLAYADDVAVTIEGNTRVELERKSATVTSELERWMELNQLSVSIEKCQYVMFKCDFRKWTSPRIIGGQRLNNWGDRPPALTKIYRGAIVPKVTYAAAIWDHTIQDRQVKSKLLTCQRYCTIAISASAATVSHAATQVIAGEPPLHMVVSEVKARELLRIRGTTPVVHLGAEFESAPGVDLKVVLRQRTIDTWQEECLHANLMQAIRTAGGTRKAKLRCVDATPESDNNMIVAPPSGDLMSDLAAKLQLRRKGISGSHNQMNENSTSSGNLMDKLLHNIPPPLAAGSNETSKTAPPRGDALRKAAPNIPS